MPKIIVQKGADILKTYSLPSKTEITIGCSTGCDVPIEDPALASELAKLVLKEDGFHLQLITHIPPVFVTGERVEGDVRLEDGDTIKIEDYNLILNVLPGEIPEKEVPPEPPRLEPKPPEPAPEKPLGKVPEPEKPPVTEKKEVPAPPASKPVTPEKPKEPPRPVTPPEPRPEKAGPGQPTRPDHEHGGEEVSYMKTEEIKVDHDADEPSQPLAEKAPLPRPPEPEPEPVKPPPTKPEPIPEPIEEKAHPQPVEDNRKTKILPSSELPPSRPKTDVSEKPVAKELDMYLLAIGGSLAGEKFKLKKGVTSIGRDRKQNDIVIRKDMSGDLDKSISRRHARIEYANGRYVFSDPESQMRSMLNGKKLAQGDAFPLSVGDIVEICSIRENSVFRVAEEGNFDFSPPTKSRSNRPAMGTGNYLPYVIVAAAAVIIIILLILLLK